MEGKLETYLFRLIEIETANPMDILDRLSIKDGGETNESDAEMDISSTVEADIDKLYETAVNFLTVTRADFIARMEATVPENGEKMVVGNLNLVDKGTFDIMKETAMTEGEPPLIYLGNGSYENCFSTFYVAFYM